MKKSISIRIPEPCHEDWQKMTQTEKGKFCSVCTKEVIDFTSKSDEDLVKSLANSKNTCGRFKKTQLNREVKLERKSGLNLLPYAASLLLPLSLLNTTSANSSANNLPVRTYSSLNIGRFSKPNRAIINTVGRITSASGKALKNVLIRANESKKIVLSDSNGNYSIKTLDHETLSFELEGFLTHKVELGSYSSEKNIAMVFEIIDEEIEVMGDMIEVVEEISEVFTIHGTVRDEDGLALPGATIIIKGTELGTQSDFDGNYSIEVEANQTLQFSYIGFTNKSILVSNISNTIDINLESSTMYLGGAVVIEMYDDNNFAPPPNASELEAQRKARKLAFKNGKEFKRLQREKQKATRKLKRSPKNQ